MGHHRCDEQGKKTNAAGQQPPTVTEQSQADEGEGHDAGLAGDEERIREDGAIAEDENKGGEEDSEGQHPKERSGGDIRREIGGECDEESRWNEGQLDPRDALLPSRKCRGRATVGDVG
jgi:hypothetical protein